MKSSAKKRPSFVRRILSRQRGRFVSPAVNPRIKELIPFGQPKGCERFRVLVLSPGPAVGETGRRGKESVTGRKARTKDERAGNDLAKGAREEERDSPSGRERKRERKREGEGMRV